MWDWISALSCLRREFKPAVLVTVSRTRGSSPRETGAKMIVLSSGETRGTIGGGHVEQLAIRDALDCLQRRENNVFTYLLSAAAGQCCGGIMELLMEVVNTGPSLYLYGAGHVGQALCRALEDTCFTVHVVDAREKWLSDPKLPEGCVKHPVSWAEFNATAAWDAQTTYAVVMTPEHSEDFEILADLLPRPLRYLGVIGSRAKWGHFQQGLEGLGFTQEAIRGIHCPVGVGHTGKAPAEIAVSIAAELLLEHYGHHEHTAPAAGGRQIQPSGIPEGPADARPADLAGNPVPDLS